MTTIERCSCDNSTSSYNEESWGKEQCGREIRESPFPSLPFRSCCRRKRRSDDDPPSSISRIWRQLGPYCVLLLCMIAAGFTFIASWSCNTFYGAEMPWFVGGGYGIWSLQDTDQNCQLWSVLFFAYELDSPLRAARFLSMTAMLSSLAAIAVLTQIIAWGRIGSWIVAIALIYWLGDSISYWWRFNIWSTFFIFTYFLMVLIVKCFLLEHYSPATLWRVGRRLLLWCCLGSGGIFFILLSNVCMCDELTEEELENNRHDDDDDYYSQYSSVVDPSLYERPENCSGMCVLGPTSHTAIWTPFLWICAWFLSRLVRPSQFSQVTGNQAARAATTASQQQTSFVDECPHHHHHQQHGEATPATTNNDNQAPRPRLGTAATFGALEDDDEEDRFDEQHKYEWNQRQVHTEEEGGVGEEAREEDEVDNMTTDTKSSRHDVSILATITESSNDDSDFHIVDMTRAGSSINNSVGEISPMSTPDKSPREKVQPEDDEEEDEDMQYDSTDSTITTTNPYLPNRQPTRWRRVEHVFLGIVVFIYVLVVLVLVGSYFENRNAAKAPATSYNFITDVVCAFHPLDPNRPFETFETTAEAKQAGYVVAHCGACGECSNSFDIEKYVETRKTVADSAKECSFLAIFGKDEELTDCLEREIGFTRSCTGCWVENMRSTAKYCMWTCLSSMLIGIAQSNTIEDAKDYDWLNQCVFCDEKRSGPEFVTCSGVARRRLGIQSEFERNPLEQCPNVEFDYVSSNLSHVFPQP